MATEPREGILDKADKLPVKEYIGFPVPLLGERPYRLPVLYREAGVLALEKPAGLLTCPHDWYPAKRSISIAVNQQARRGKPELQRLGVEKIYPFYALETEASGVALFATSSSSGKFYRNQHGSGGMRFKFLLLARSTRKESEIDCQLPLARHVTKARLEVSHRRGKKSQTKFTLQSRWGAFSMWEATTVYYRVHMVRLHSAESGLPIAGDQHYGSIRPVFLSQLKRDYRVNPRKKEQPLYGNLCLHLGAVEFTDEEGQPQVVRAELPRPWQVLIKKLEQHTEGGT